MSFPFSPFFGLRVFGLFLWVFRILEFSVFQLFPVGFCCFWFFGVQPYQRSYLFPLGF